MLRIEIAHPKDANAISKLAMQTFKESHGHSAAPAIIQSYLDERLNPAVIMEELNLPTNHYRLAYWNEELVGFSKILFDAPNSKIAEQHVCKLERLYVLSAYHDQKLGYKLFEENVQLAKQHQQQGMWLYVWTENQRALRFYKKLGFNIISSTLFRLTETHSNPNYWMYLEF